VNDTFRHFLSPRSGRQVHANEHPVAHYRRYGGLIAALPRCDTGPLLILGIVITGANKKGGPRAALSIQRM
jgi:hypothetical protein